MLQAITRNRTARNFGLGSRDIDKAAKFALQEGGASYSTVATQTNRFKQFSRFIRQRHGIKDLRWIQNHHVIEYAEHLNEWVEDEKLTAQTAQNRLSAVNRVLEQARGNKQVWVSPTAYLPGKSGIAKYNRAPNDDLVDQAKEVLGKMKYGDRYKVILGSGGVLGLRFKEAALLDYKKAMAEAKKFGKVTIYRGTKGGKKRFVPIKSSAQIDLLSRGVAAQGSSRNLIPSGYSYKKFHDLAYRAIAKTPLNGWHGMRHRFVQRRYKSIMKVDCPIVAGVKHGINHHRYIADSYGCSIKLAKIRDIKAREEIAEEVGHSRAESTNAYLG